MCSRMPILKRPASKVLQPARSLRRKPVGDSGRFDSVFYAPDAARKAARRRTYFVRRYPSSHRLASLSGTLIVPYRSGRATRCGCRFVAAPHGIRDAEARGCRVMDGLAILVNQGVIGIKYWTGVDADVTVMRKALGALQLKRPTAVEFAGPKTQHQPTLQQDLARYHDQLLVD